MKRSIRKDIRWNEYELARIDLVREDKDFSEFVRDATMNRVYNLENELGNTKK